MSAIFGLWHKNGAPQIEPSLNAIEHALREWQCDARGVWFDTHSGSGDERVGLGTRLLYTTPESQHERLPFTHTEFPHLLLTADAWLDNRAALCDTFQISHAERATTCDSELILRAYAKWGDACAEKLRGDFAFALWDAQREHWYCARDFMGCKPLFYFDAPQLFSFASDVRGVLACPTVPNNLDETMLAAYLVQATTTAELRRTFFQNIFKLPPAHFLIITRDAARLTRYWTPANVPEIYLPTPEAYFEHAQAVLERAVQNATRTTYRVGAHLSGGLDSTTVAILAARNIQTRGETLNGYSWSPPPSLKNIADDADERAFIETVCALENITPRYLEYNIVDVTNIYMRDVTRVPREMVLREEQVQDTSARDGVRVLLSGWGGDELFSYSGRGYLPDLFQRGAYRQLHAEIKRRIPKNIHSAGRVRAYGSIVYRQMFWHLMPDLFWGRYSPYGGLRQNTAFIQLAFLQQHRQALRAMRDPIPRDYPSVRVTQTARLTHGHLSRRMESWVTHGARRGIVYRYPLLAREIVELTLGLPPHLYFDGNRSRAVLRNATRGILPETIRATRAKTEPTAIGVVGDTLLQATYALYEQTRPHFANHPATQYVNPAALQSHMDSRKLVWTRASPVLEALSCFYISPDQTSDVSETSEV